MSREECVFCRIWTGDLPAEIVWQEKRVMAFVPLNPVTEGHVLVVPNVHVRDFMENAAATAETGGVAARLASELGGSFNLITSAGAPATQTVWHLHMHLVPRTEGDGLLLPWSKS